MVLEARKKESAVQVQATREGLITVLQNKTAILDILDW